MTVLAPSRPIVWQARRDLRLLAQGNLPHVGLGQAAPDVTGLAVAPSAHLRLSKLHLASSD